jgi:uncharacterized membrane protein
MVIWKIILSAILSFVPVVELRGGIPVAILSGLNPWYAFLLCVFINILITPFVFFFLDVVHKKLIKYKFYKKTINVILKRAEKRSRKLKKKINKYSFLALAIFVAIPLPGTGAWTGSIIAWLLKLNRRKSFLAISLGVIIAGILITLALTGIISLF